MAEIPEVDLLGEPMRELADPRGRPKHRVTAENRIKVSVLRASGMDRAEIAEAVGVSEPTLSKYYFSELNEGVARERAAAVMLLRGSAEAGNVAAQRALIALYERGTTGPRVPAADPTAKMGKKEQLKLSALEGHEETSWGGVLPN